LPQSGRRNWLIHTTERCLSRMQPGGHCRWLPSIAVVFLLILSVALLTLIPSGISAERHSFPLTESVRALIRAVLLLNLYIAYKQIQVRNIQRRSAQQDEIFRLIGQHAADMIAFVDTEGNRLYNSPSYKSILGYSPEELEGSSAFEQIHPDDRQAVKEAAQQAPSTGVGRRLEYRIRHKDGSWRILESTASAIRDTQGRVEKLVIVNRDISDRREIEERLQHNAFHDPLTDLPNRNLFLDRLERALDRTRRKPEYGFAILFIDIDGFKAFNDTMGHRAGDQLIREIARRLSGSLRFDDIVARPTLKQEARSRADGNILARLGGDEFTLLLSGVSDPGNALRVARRIQNEISLPVSLRGQTLFLSASIGIALSAKPHSSADELLGTADLAMHRAKTLGKCQCEIFDTEMHAAAVQRLNLETDLHKALDRQEFELHYQPIISLKSGRIMGFEALLRWNHPQQGLRLPGEFISVAEDTGLIVPIGRWVLRENCGRIRAWQEEYPGRNPPDHHGKRVCQAILRPQFCGRRQVGAGGEWRPSELRTA
jgi:PAS domain S-box-containing protein